jgi:hypothetical protein
VVEWDATDLAGFEAKASRNLVFVKYQGCKIKMLYGCSDSGVPGRYGAYDSPVFTSGTVESFEMRDQSEVYAKLPLGADRFGVEASRGRMLELRYFVSGAVNSTRDYVERSAIADNGRCRDATHFVSAYSLGAFRLLSHQQAQRGAGVVVAGREESAESSNLKNGGDLADCESRTQQHCRVPIRLVLQPIDETTQDLDASAGGAPRPDPEPAEDTVSERASKLRAAALAKADAGDGPGCLSDLDRADALDRSDRAMSESMTVRGLCTMVAGDCEGGKKVLMEAVTLADENKTASDLQVQAYIHRSAMYRCPLAQLDEAGRGSAIFYRIREARKLNQPARCDALGQAALDLIQEQRKAGKKPDMWSVDALSETSDCLASLRDCKRARHWTIQVAVEGLAHLSPDEARAQGERSWAGKRERLGCKE